MNKEQFFSEDAAKTIVDCISDAVGDDILEDIQRNKLATTNSIPSRIWDLINTNLCNKLCDMNCEVVKTNSGPWQMCLIWDKSSDVVITLMREERFSEIRRKQSSRGKMHYLDALTEFYNNELNPEYAQTTFYGHEFTDKDRLSERVNTLLRNIQSDISEIKNHVLVLFESIDNRLVSVRAIKATPALEIAKDGEWSLSEYIDYNESAIVEKVDNENQNDLHNMGLKLKEKAIAKQKKLPLRTEEQKQEIL